MKGRKEKVNHDVGALSLSDESFSPDVGRGWPPDGTRIVGDIASSEKSLRAKPSSERRSFHGSANATGHRSKRQQVLPCSTMDYHGFLGYASDKMVNFAIETLRRSDSPLDLNLSRSLDLYGKNPDFYGTNADPSIVFSYSPPPLPRVVLEQTLVQLDAETKSKGPSIDPAILPTLRKGVVTISSFISLLLKELRELICGKGKNPKKLGPQWHALLSH